MVSCHCGRFREPSSHSSYTPNLLNRSGPSAISAAVLSSAPIPDARRAPGRLGEGIWQRVCFRQPISGALPLRRYWRHCCRLCRPGALSPAATSSIPSNLTDGASCGLANGNLLCNFDLRQRSTLRSSAHTGFASAAASCVRLRLSVRPCPARTYRTGPRRRCQNNPSDCVPSRSCTRHRGYSPRRQAPAAGPAP